MIGAHWIFFVGLLGCGDKDESTSETGCEADCDTGDTGDTTSNDTGDTGDTGEPSACATATATFIGDYGLVEDLTEDLTDGTYTTLGQPGRLEICPGTWFVRLILEADIDVIGLGTTPEDTILSGGDSGTILDLSGSGVLVRVENVTLDRGAGLYQKKHNLGGGAVACSDEASLFVQDVIFSNSTADDGAGLYGRECEIDVTSVTFENNAVDDDGGAVTLWYSTATFQDVTFSNNSALDGGAMAMFYSDVSISEATFKDNSSSWFSAGIWTFDSALALTDVSFSGNENSGGEASGFGGALLAYGEASLERVSFEDNAARLGGGLFVYTNAVVEGIDVDFGGNTEHDVWIADYSEEGGQGITAGTGLSFSCADNVCEGF